MATLEETFQGFLNQLDTQITNASTPAELGVLQQQLERISKSIHDGMNVSSDLIDKINNSVPNARTVNGKVLSSDITLLHSDVGAVQKKVIVRYQLQFINNWSIVGGFDNSVTKDSEGFVVCNIRISGGDTGPSVVVGTIPAEYAPSISTIVKIVVRSGTVTGNPFAVLYSNGDITVFNCDGLTDIGLSAAYYVS